MILCLAEQMNEASHTAYFLPFAQILRKENVFVVSLSSSTDLASLGSSDMTRSGEEARHE